MISNGLLSRTMTALIAAGCLSSGIVAGCGSDSPTTPLVAAPSIATVSDADNGKSVRLANGGTLTVTLASNASTGFSWKVTSTDAQRLPQAGSSVYVAPPAGSPPGAGGFQVFSFKAQAPGTVPLSLEYDPPGGGAPGRTFTVSVVIQ